MKNLFLLCLLSLTSLGFTTGQSLSTTLIHNPEISQNVCSIAPNQTLIGNSSVQLPSMQYCGHGAGG